MKKTDKPEAPGDFEAALAELESIVKQLEDGGPDLDRSLVLFERGVELARLCKQRLDAAELRVAKLVKDREELFREEPADAGKE
ncbi:MAG: exodeoxyribonuclease VII small subunit [bacterium]